MLSNFLNVFNNFFAAPVNHNTNQGMPGYSSPASTTNIFNNYFMPSANYGYASAPANTNTYNNFWGNQTAYGNGQGAGMYGTGGYGMTGGYGQGGMDAFSLFNSRPGPQPIYGYPNPTSALTPNHMLYPMISTHLNLIAKYSQAMGLRTQAPLNPFNPGIYYYTNGVPGTYDNVAGAFSSSNFNSMGNYNNTAGTFSHANLGPYFG